jgi:hypothetical protein
MKHTITFLALLILLTSFAMHCMEKELPVTQYDIFYHTTPSKTIQEIQNNATQILTNLTSAIDTMNKNNRQEPSTLLSFALSPSINTALIYSQPLAFINNRNETAYSLLGTTTIMSDKSFSFKKDIITELINLTFKPTPKDKELALLEKWIRCESTRKKIYLFSCAYHNKTSVVSLIPHELVKLIMLITFNTEESLFDGLS